MSAERGHFIKVLERGDTSAGRGLTCSLGNELSFDRGALERCSSAALEDVDVDLLVVLASVAFADRRVSRRRGTRWGRQISLSIPVFVRQDWERAAPDLVSLLHDLSGDTWRFEFRERESDDDLRQLFLPRLPREFRGGTVVPYSGGLDSFATVARHAVERSGEPLLLVHARHGTQSLDAFPSGERRTPALSVPFTVSAGPHAEPSYRTRTFTFFSLAALACRMNNAARIWIGEGGIGCFGPAFVPFGIEQPVSGCHPTFITKLARFFRRLWGSSASFELPNLWLTKGEVLAQLQASSAFDGWTRTHSCSRNVRRQHPTTAATHCGLCAGCIFRRQSLRAAGLCEDRGTYYADVFVDDQLPADHKPADREVGIYAAVALDELARVSGELPRHRSHVVEAASSLGQPLADVEKQLHRLFSKQAEEWHAFVSALPLSSWLRDVVKSREGADELWTTQN